MQENQGTVMATKANNVDGYEVPFQKDVGKLLGKFGLAWPDLLLIITLLETAWWITFGFLDGADVTLRTTFDYNDQLYPVYMLVKRTVCLARLAGVIWCVWYSCIIQVIRLHFESELTLIG
ncbi:hypothetical protein Ocin01_18246 [Orchesella cincta]|uniref:Uncharacterized protein n=1 Tax=Orchesella cincta TaxID=48709 RepID=A0A1D2M637_ORCCI|nr:hypothetical protein Ocin01_18246 [Orchesella cincta]